MDYKEYKFDNYTIHFIKTNKFKSTFLSMVLINDFKEESLIKNFVLRKLLTSSSKKLTDEIQVARQVYDLYNAGIVISNNICNNVITTNFDVEILQDKYTEEGLTKKAIDNFFDFIFNPNIEDNEFEEKNYNLTITSIKDYFEREKDNKRRYAFNKAYELFSEGYLKYNPNGTKEDLKKVTRKNMVTYYEKLIKEANASIWAIGDFNDEEMLEIINSNVKDKLYKNNNNYIDGNFTKKTKLKTGEDIENNNQSILIMIYKILNMTQRERNVILPIFNRILGDGNNSKLFKNVREKNSLCYDIRSTISREESVLTISSGINAENKDKTINLIQEEIKEIQKGNIKDEFEEAIKFRNRRFRQFEDNNSTILYIKQGSVFFGSDDLEKRKENLKTVTMEEIIELSKKIEISTIYMLKGEKNHE
ncbi:MAG: insulinase family protein [Bacilli bacterium]|nr:insulinase family protein [Bacilli bacterium]MBO6194799.1 insulinase family protein [Bacilli bacterium]